MKKRFILPGFLSLVIGFTACSNGEEVFPSQPKYTSVAAIQSPCEPLVTDLIAGQNINAGNIIVTNDATNLYVTYNMTGGWELLETQLYVGSFEDIPTTPNGNPKIGNFPYKNDSVYFATTYTYTIPLTSLNGDPCMVVAAHASVGLPDSTGLIAQKETAWGAGTRLTSSGNWAMYSIYCICNNDGGMGDDGTGGGIGGN
jgi:hypothetical protein